MRSNASQTTVLTQKVGAYNTVAPLVIPPDGGWGWVIVFVGFCSLIIVDGVSYCFYLFRDPMAHDLGVPPGDISLLSALFTGFYFFGGIAACSIGNYWGFRIVMILGAAFCCMGFGLGYILDNVLHFFISIGFVGGTGAGFISIASSLPAGFYFDKKRSVVMGFVSCGSGVGAIVVPHMTKLFMDEFGWRLACAFIASLFVLIIFLALLIRPLRPVLVLIRNDSNDDSVDMIFRMPTIDTSSIGPISQAPSQMIIQIERMSTATMRDVGSHTNLTLFRAPRQHSDIQSTHIRSSVLPNISQMVQDSETISIMVRDKRPSTIARLRIMTQSKTLQPSVSILTSTIEIEEEVLPPLTRLPWYKCGCCRSTHSSVPDRPMHRTDLYYTGSLNRLDEYVTKDKDLEYHFHVTKVPTYFEVVQDLTRTYTTWCCYQILYGIKSLLDYSLLKSPTFLCLALCGLADYVAFFLPFLFIKTRLEKMGVGHYDTEMISMIGMGSLIGRISSGIIVTGIPRFDAHTTVLVTNFLAGLTAISFTFYENIFCQFGCMLVFGCTIGFFTPLRSIIIVDFMGLNKLTSATGMMTLFQGVGGLSGATIAEAIMDFTKDDNAPFYLCGGSLIFASLVLSPMRIFQKWEERRKEKLASRRNEEPVE